MLERRHELVRAVAIMPQPMEKLGESPLRGVDSSTPLDRLQAKFVCFACDLGSFFPGPVIAPEIVLVERLKIFSYRDDARSGGVERHGPNAGPFHTGRSQRFTHGAYESCHVVRMALRGLIGIVAAAMKRVVRSSSPQTSPIPVENRDPYAKRSKIYTCDDCAHEALSLRFLREESDEVEEADDQEDKS